MSKIYQICLVAMCFFSIIVMNIQRSTIDEYESGFKTETEVSMLLDPTKSYLCETINAKLICEPIIKPETLNHVNSLNNLVHGF